MIQKDPKQGPLYFYGAGNPPASPNRAKTVIADWSMLPCLKLATEKSPQEGAF
jgi:hypothetical protein